MTATVQIQSKGVITLPIALREKYKLEKGKTLSVIDLGEGKILLTTKASRLSKITARIEKRFKEENVTLDDILEQLDEERKTYNREHYLDDPRVAEKSGLKIGTPGDVLAWLRERL